MVGAGPGGLTAAMLLAARGFKVTLVEKAGRVGGRNAAIERNGYKFDTGPTFLMMKFILDEVFEESGRKSEDYLKFVKLEPMYRLQFDDMVFEPTTDHAAMLKQLNEKFPGNAEGYWRFLETEQERAVEQQWPGHGGSSGEVLGQATCPPAPPLWIGAATLAVDPM